MRCSPRVPRCCGPELAGRFPGTGTLLAGAVADERLGVDTTVSRVEGFFTEPGRFPPHWITAVRETLSRARAL
jgi:hypothetical protein